MTCKAPCFDCPFLRGSDNLSMTYDEMEVYVHDYLTVSDGGHKEIICEEQEDVCFGQLQIISNSHCDVDPFSDFGEVAESLQPNWKDYFIGVWEFMAYHAI